MLNRLSCMDRGRPLSSAVRNHHLPALRRSGAPAFQSFPREKSQSNGGRRCPMISRSQHPVLPPFFPAFGYVSIVRGIGLQCQMKIRLILAGSQLQRDATVSCLHRKLFLTSDCALMRPLRQFCGKPQSGTVSPAKSGNFSKKASPYRSSLTCPTPVISRSASLSRGSRRHISRSVTSAKTM